jgi:membrane-bound ClpP family serine protease
MEKQTFVFERKNYVLLIAGIVLMIFGYLLMMGGGSDDPQVFNPEIFSAQRIIVAPILIIAGLVLEVFAIMIKGKPSNG